MSTSSASVPTEVATEASHGSARHLEYAHVWQKQHTVVEHFTWKPAT